MTSSAHFSVPVLLTLLTSFTSAYKSSAADSLLAERSRIDHSHRMTDDVLESDISRFYPSPVLIYLIGKRTRRDLNSRNKAGRWVGSMSAWLVLFVRYTRHPGVSLPQTDIPRITETMPGINNLIGMIKSRRRRDAYILGALIGLCLFALFSYIW